MSDLYPKATLIIDYGNSKMKIHFNKFKLITNFSTPMTKANIIDLEKDFPEYKNCTKLFVGELE